MRKIDQFKIKAEVEVNTSEAKEHLNELSDQAKDTSEDLDDLGNKGSKNSSKLGKFFSSFGKGALFLGKWSAIGIGAAATAIGGVTVKALSAAGELEQNMGGAESVFKSLGSSIGEMQTEIITGYDESTGKAIKAVTTLEDVSKNAFKNMGLSQSDYLATTNKMGALFQGAGFDTQTALDMSSQAMQRAADVASIMGIDTASAMEAIAGAAKGNFTMMDNLGVAMNDTTIQAYALEKGIKKSTTEMTNQEKIGLAMEMFMKKTAYAAGNYAKENETLAGSLGTAKAAFSNFLSGAGSVDDVVSSFSNLANVVVKNIDEMFPKLMTGFTQIVEKLVPLIPPLLQKVLPGLIEGATGLINGLVAALPAVLNALMGALPALIQGVQTIFNALIGALPQIMQTLVAALPSLLPQLITAIINLIVMLCTMLPQIIQPIIDNLPQIIISIVNALIANLPALIQGLVQLVVGIVQALPQILSALWTALTSLCNQATSKLFGKISEWIRKLFPKSADTIFKILDTIKSAFQTFINNIKAIFSVVVTVISTPFKLAWNAIKTVWNIVVDYFKMIWNNIKAVFSVVDSVLSGDFKGAWEGIKKIWSNVGAFFKNVVSHVKNAFSNVGEILTAPFKKGKEAIGKIVDNIKGFFKGLKLNFPKIKLPHFSVSPSGWKIGDLLKGSIPKLGIEWYAKAMNNPMVMTKPTIFGYNAETGKLQGGGDAGSEVVSGTSTLMNMIQGAVSAQNNTIVVYLQHLIEILATYFPQILEAAGHDIVADDGTVLAYYVPKIDTELGRIKSRKERGR